MEIPITLFLSKNCDKQGNRNTQNHHCFSFLDAKTNTLHWFGLNNGNLLVHSSEIMRNSKSGCHHSDVFYPKAGVLWHWLPGIPGLWLFLHHMVMHLASFPTSLPGSDDDAQLLAASFLPLLDLPCKAFSNWITAHPDQLGHTLTEVASSTPTGKDYI